jgi:hypothetical protein
VDYSPSADFRETAGKVSLLPSAGANITIILSAWRRLIARIGACHPDMRGCIAFWCLKNIRKRLTSKRHCNWELKQWVL